MAKHLVSEESKFGRAGKKMEGGYRDWQVENAKRDRLSDSRNRKFNSIRTMHERQVQITNAKALTLRLRI